MMIYLVNFASQADLAPCDLTSADSLCNFSEVIQDENIKPQVNINVGLNRPFRNPVVVEFVGGCAVGKICEKYC